MAVLSMFLGSIAGIGQRDIKRLMAYSSISHMGFALVGLAAGTVVGVEAMLLYMAIYAVMGVGAFAFILAMERNGRAVTALDDLNLLARTEPLKAAAMLVLLFSLAGVPPFLADQENRCAAVLRMRSGPAAAARPRSAGRPAV